uniref:Uncharacterized protein AlNc14C138G7174 n=1 Tax=Albugo laibachii Nc14 TaxID=890382 RepID=F0WKY4_9STRA|nr:conserved hypothetical protein [Albugo laibachii Nc14]CCA24792.1 conserved hypothetical protein [Albugo laibachii Nc14]|eukprot:CCA24792.1 conserved hypothetical protein [Albugo laibachii Nc14]
MLCSKILIQDFNGMTLDVYLLRDDIEDDGIQYSNLMQEFQLETYMEKMNATKLPQTYHHLLRGVVGNTSNRLSEDVKSNLVGLLDGVPFDRPIQPLPENFLRAAFQLPVGSKPGPLMQRVKEKDGKHTGMARSPSSQTAVSGGKASTTAEKAKGKSEDKKEKKRRKREREDANMLQKILAPLVMELRDVTWVKWIVHGKPSNPFIQKITRDNCKRLGVPTYFEYVTEAMDLTRMKEKVEKAEYHKIDQFSHDVQQVVKNATTFNRAGEPVHQMALELEQLYFSKLKTYRSTFEELQQERKKRKKEEKKKKKEKKKKGE